jgi:hypothetical protein
MTVTKAQVVAKMDADKKQARASAVALVDEIEPDIDRSILQDLKTIDVGIYCIGYKEIPKDTGVIEIMNELKLRYDDFEVYIPHTSDDGYVTIHFKPR